MMVEPMQSDDHQIPRDILEGMERGRAERERAMRELKAMTKEQRLEACRAFVEATLEYGDDLHVWFYPPWQPWNSKGEVRKSLTGQTSQTHGYTTSAKTEPVLLFSDFTRDELVAILKPMGKVDDWRDKVPPPIVALISSWKDGHRAKDETYGPIVGKRLKEARLALEMDIATFYGRAGMTKKTAIKWEGGDIPAHFIAFGERRFKAISEAHTIPLEWLLCLDVLNADYHRREAGDDGTERAS